MTDIVLGIRLKADGSDLVGTVKGSEEALKKLREETGKGASEAAKLNAEHQNMARTMSDNANKIGAYSAGWNLLTNAITSAAGSIKDYIKDSAMLAARHETLGVVMGVVGRNAGYSAAEMNAHAEAVRKSGITMNESREVVIKLAQANIDLSLASKLARAAQDAAVIGNMNSTEALERMTHGIVSGQTEILRAIGINVNFEDSYKKMAKQLGVTTEQLTEQEKVQARANVVLEYSTRLQGTYEAAMGTAGKQINSLKRYEEDLKTLRGEIWNEALIIAVEAYTGSLKGANEEARKLSHDGNLKEWGRDTLTLFAGLADAALFLGRSFRQVVESVATVGLEGASWLLNAAKSNPIVWIQNKMLGDPIGGLQGIASDFSERTNNNMRNRWGGSNTPFSDRLAAQLATRDAEARAAALDNQDAANEMAMGRLMFGPNYKPGVRGTPGRPTGGGSRAAVANGAESFYAQTMSQFENQIDKAGDGEITHFDKLARAIAKAEAAGVKFDQWRIMDMETAARQLDGMEREKKALDDLVKSTDAQAEAEKRRQAIYTDMFMSMSEQANGIAEETRLIGMSARARDEHAAMVRLETTYRAALAKVADGDLETLEKINNEYARQKSMLPDLVRARSEAKEADAAQKESLREFTGLWSTVEGTGRTVFNHLFSHGDDTFKNLGKSLKASLIDLLYQLTARKWIIDIGTRIAGSIGLGTVATAANAAGGGGSPLGGLGNLFSSGAGSLWNAIGGNGVGSGIADVLFKDLSMATGGSQFIADIGNFGFGAPVIGGLVGMLTGNVKGGLMSAGLGAIGNMLLPGVGGVIGSIAGNLLGGLGGKKTPAVLTGKDIPAGLVAYGGGLSGTMYGNDSNQGYRWAGEQWSGVFRSEIDALYQDVERMGRLLGRDVSGVRGTSATVSTGTFMNAQDILPTVLSQTADALARKVIPNLDEFAQANETASQTLLRMAAEAQKMKLDSVFNLMGGAISLQDSTSDLWLSDLSPLTATERMNRSNARYSELLGLARGGDARAMNELGSFTRSNVQELAGYYGTSTPEYRTLFEQRQAEVEGLVNDTLTEQSIQFAEMGLTMKDIAANTKDLDKRLAAALEKAIAAYQAAQAAITQASTQQIVQAVNSTAQTTAFTLASAASAAFGNQDNTD